MNHRNQSVEQVDWINPHEITKISCALTVEACLHVTCMCYYNQVYDNVDIFVRALRRANKCIRINVYCSHCMRWRLQ